MSKGAAMRMNSYKAYLLLVLLACLALNKVEHAALGVMLQHIKTDLALSDTQLGLLTGIAFTLFYATLGVPVGRWADRGDRVWVISITTALQCGALALSAVAGNFLQFLFMRVGVAVGEAGAVAPANSLIAEYFDRQERARATTIFMLGYPASAISGYFLGGWLNDLLGWRITFVVLGLPGLAVALLARLTLKDPRTTARSDIAAPARRDTDLPTLPEVARALWGNRSFRHLVIGYSLMTFFGIGVVMWLPTFFIRTYGFSTTRLGLWLALIWGIGGISGSLLAAKFAGARVAGSERRTVGALSLIFCLSGLIAAGVYLSPSPYLALALIVPIAAVNYGTAGPLFATIQSLTPERMRAVAVSMTYLCTNLIGVGLGPLAVGALSDRLTPGIGHDALRYALLALCPGYVWAAWHFWRARRTIEADLAAAPIGAPRAAGTPQLQESSL